MNCERRIEALARGEGDVRGRGGALVDRAIEMLDTGELRVAEPDGDDWIDERLGKASDSAVLRAAQRDWIGAASGRLVYYDKLPVKRNYEQLGVRCVPPGVARYGSFLGRNVILMPGFVNIGAYVDEGSMIDTWATVGSCAQIGRDVHLSGGVGIGGVLEPPQAAPVIVEDGAFVGSRCIVVEGVRVEREAVLGAGVVLTASTPIVDVAVTDRRSQQGPHPRPRRRHSRDDAEGVSGGRVRNAVRANRRHAQRSDGS